MPVDNMEELSIEEAFEKINEAKQVNSVIHNNMTMGSLGEGYSFLNKILPNTYRINAVPSELYDGMIIVTEATPTVIKE